MGSLERPEALRTREGSGGLVAAVPLSQEPLELRPDLLGGGQPPAGREALAGRDSVVLLLQGTHGSGVLRRIRNLLVDLGPGAYGRLVQRLVGSASPLALATASSRAAAAAGYSICAT